MNFKMSQTWSLNIRDQILYALLRVQLCLMTRRTWDFPVREPCQISSREYRPQGACASHGWLLPPDNSRGARWVYVQAPMGWEGNKSYLPMEQFERKFFKVISFPVAVFLLIRSDSIVSYSLPKWTGSEANGNLTEYSKSENWARSQGASWLYSQKVAESLRATLNYTS